MRVIGGIIVVNGNYNNHQFTIIPLRPDSVQNSLLRTNGCSALPEPRSKKSILKHFCGLNNLSAIEDFCSRLEVLPYGAKAAQHYGAIRGALEKLGQPIGVNDLHIAGHARSEGLVLVTNNMSEFERVPALEVENWVHPSQ